MSMQRGNTAEPDGDEAFRKSDPVGFSYIQLVHQVLPNCRRGEVHASHYARLPGWENHTTSGGERSEVRVLSRSFRVSQRYAAGAEGSSPSGRDTLTSGGRKNGLSPNCVHLLSYLSYRKTTSGIRNVNTFLLKGGDYETTKRFGRRLFFATQNLGASEPFDSRIGNWLPALLVNLSARGRSSGRSHR